ncbi:MAG: hypothetical protein ABIK44_05190 [candidate division WOR-3 bacterium]
MDRPPSEDLRPLEEDFRRLEERIDAVLALVARLRQENQHLREQLDEARCRRQEAIERLNIILDKIAALR